MTRLPAWRGPRPRTLLFDWDNTLVDSWAAIHHALNATLAELGLPTWTLAETMARVRRSAREAFPAWFGPRADEAARIFYAAFEARHLENLRPCPGAEAMLARLHAAGYDLAVVSNKQGRYLRAEAERLGWDRYFRRLVGANDAVRDKPAPEAVALALSGGPSETADRGKVWLIGDTDIDLQCAVESGCVPVLLRDEPPADGEFAAAPPSLHLSDCRTLADILAAMR